MQIVKDLLGDRCISSTAGGTAVVVYLRLSLEWGVVEGPIRLTEIQEGLSEGVERLLKPQCRGYGRFFVSGVEKGKSWMS